MSYRVDPVTETRRCNADVLGLAEDVTDVKDTGGWLDIRCLKKDGVRARDRVRTGGGGWGATQHVYWGHTNFTTLMTFKRVPALPAVSTQGGPNQPHLPLGPGVRKNLRAAKPSYILEHVLTILKERLRYLMLSAGAYCHSVLQ